ncbi:MAG: DUF5777 family beta-barrel protein [Flavobacteriaceae bacterium]|jgi:hypothetical protein
MMKPISTLFLLFSTLTLAQTDLLDELDANLDMGPLYAESAFKGLKIINLESTKMVDTGEMYFVVAHRFGSIKNGFDDFFGLDVASNKLQLIYGLNNHINFGIARSSYQKTYAFHTKLRLLRQQNEQSPVTIGAYGQLTINNQLNLDLNPGLDFNHRLTYTAQALVSRKFSEKLSLQLSPTLIHKNLTEVDEENNMQFVMAAGGRYKLSKRISLNMDYGLVTNRPEELNYNNMLSIGLDIETGGHVFQLHFTNSRSMLEHGFLTEASGDWSGGDIHFGFNISRVFDW